MKTRDAAAPESHVPTGEAPTGWEPIEEAERPGLTERPLDYAAVLVSAIFVVAGVVFPQVADLLLRLFFVIIALGFVALQAYRTIEPVASAERVYSPFDGRGAQPAAAQVPLPLRDIELELEAAETVWGERRRVIPEATVDRIRKEASRRLAERHGLDLHEPDHHERIRALVSESTWNVLLPAYFVRTRAGSAFTSAPVPLTELGTVLDDLEKL